MGALLPFAVGCNGSVYRVKKSLHASEQDMPRVQALRAAWRRIRRRWNAQKLVFIDESGLHSAMTRLYGRAPRGQRVMGSVPQNYGEPVTVLAALDRHGMPVQHDRYGPLNSAPATSPMGHDSQSAKTTECGGPRGYDGGKKISGRKRHLVVDTQGFVLNAVVQEADLADREGACEALDYIHTNFPRLKHVWMDMGYRSERLRQWMTAQHLEQEIVQNRAARCGAPSTKSHHQCPPLRFSSAAGLWSAPSPGWAEIGA